MSLRQSVLTGLGRKRILTVGSFARDVTVTLFFQGVALAMGIANTAVIARALGPEGMGVVALALLIPGMLELFLGCGIGVANVYFAGSSRFEVRDLVANSVAFTLSGSLAAVVIVVIAIRTGLLNMVLPGLPTTLVVLAVLAVPIGLLTGYFAAILQGLQRVRIVSAVGMLQALLGLVATLVLVAGFDLGLVGVMFAVLAGGIAALFGLGIVLRSEGVSFTPAFRPRVVRATLSFGVVGQLGNVLQFFNYRLDILIVNAFVGPAAVGIYSVSTRLAELLWHLPNAVGFVIFPKAAATKRDAMDAFTPRVFRVTLTLTALVGAILAVLSKPLITIIYSPQFAAAFMPLLILLPGVVALGGAKVLTNEIAGRGYPQYNSVNAGVALVATVALDLLLIPRYGIVGAALASSIVYVMLLGLAMLFYSRVSGAGTLTSDRHRLTDLVEHLPSALPLEQVP